MTPKRLFFALLIVSGCLILSTSIFAQSKSAPEPRTRDGKKLLTALDLMKINAVGTPRISPDGSRVVYTVSEVRTEKDKEWKTVTQVWAVPTAGGKPRQFTRGDKSATLPGWSPDGTMIAFLTDRE